MGGRIDDGAAGGEQAPRNTSASRARLRRRIGEIEALIGPDADGRQQFAARRDFFDQHCARKEPSMPFGVHVRRDPDIIIGRIARLGHRAYDSGDIPSCAAPPPCFACCCSGPAQRRRPMHRRATSPRMRRARPPLSTCRPPDRRRRMLAPPKRHGGFIPWPTR